jgi:tetratricopeptide (TPR) repeat protein
MTEEAALRDPKAFKQLEERLYSEKKWTELVSAYASRALALEDMDQRERLLFQAGQIAEKNLQDPVAAGGYYRRAFDVRRSFVRALAALRALHQDRKDWGRVAEAIELEFGATVEVSKRARLQKELGDALCQQEGLDPEEAIKAYARALEIDSKQRPALAELEKLCRKHQKWPKLVAAYKKLGDASSGKDAAVFHFLAGGILDERMKAPDLAAKAYKSSLQAGPEDARILGTIVAFFEKRKSWVDVIEALEAQTLYADNAKEKAKLLRKIASICEKNQGNSDLAAVHYRRALDVRADDAEALGRLKTIAEAKNDDAGVAEALEREARNLDLPGDEKADRYEKAAERREKVGELDAAAGDLQLAIELRPRSPRALKTLERLTKKLARWPEHARVLELEAGLLDPSRSAEEKAATLAIERKLAEVRERFLQDPKGALASLSRILSIDPDDQDAVARVETLARRQKDWARVAQALARRAEKTKDDAARAKVLVELAQLRETELVDGKGAAEAWEDALARDRELAPRALAALRTLYERSKDTPGLARTLARLVEAARGEPSPERAQLFLDLGSVELERGETAAAIAALRESLALEPEGATALEARRRLADAARKRNDPETLRSILHEVAARDPDLAVARSARLELARLEEKELHPKEALKLLEEQLALSPADEEALPNAARILASQGLVLEAAERLEVASHSLESDEPARAAGFAREGARILENEAQARAGKSGAESASELLSKARLAWQRVLELAPEDDAAAERLADLCRRTGDSQGLEEVLERACGRTSVPAARARLNKERAALARGPRKLPEEAASLYQRVLKDAPLDAEATGALLELFRELERWGELADLLEAVAAREPGSQVRASDRLALTKPEESDKTKRSVPDARAALEEAAQVAAEKLSDLPRAVACLERLSDRAPEDDRGLALLAGYLERLSRPRDLERVLDRRAKLAPDAGARADIHLRRGAVLAKDLEDHSGALDAYGKCLEARPGDRNALEGLARARHALGDVRGATQALALAAESALAAGDAQGAARLEVARGDMALARRDLVEAEAAYRAAVARAPALEKAHDSLAKVLAQRADWTALEKALGEAASVASEPASGGERGRPRKAELLVERALLLAERLEKGELALEALDEAEVAAPDTALVLDARARVLRRQRRFGPLAETLEKRRALAARKGTASDENALAPGELVTLLRDEAQLRAHELGELDRARALLDQARKLVPQDSLVVSDLLRIERSAARAGALAGDSKAGPSADSSRLLALLVEAAELEKRPRAKAELLIEAGRTAKLKLQDPKRASQLFKAALAADETRLEGVRWLQGLAREADDQEALAEWLAREAEGERDPKRRAQAQARLGDCERRRGRPDAARKCYEAALALDANLVTALRHLAPLLRRAKDWAPLAQVLETLAKLEPDKHGRVERLVLLGEIRLRRLDDRKGARAAFDEALALEATDIHALRGRAKTLDPKAEARELVTTLETELKMTPSAARRAEIHKRIGELKQERLSDLDGAAKAFSAAIRIRPDDAKARDALRYVHMAARDWGRLAKSYEDEARRSTERALKEERFRQAALIRHHHLNELERAIALYKEVLALGDPECLAIETLPKLLESPDREDERLQVLARIPEIVPGSREAEEALLELGAIREKRGDRGAAQALYEQLLERSKGHPKALDALVALHRSANDLPRLAEALDRKRAALAKPESARVRLERGKVLEDLRDLDAAALEYEAAAEEDPRDQEAIGRLRTIYARRERFPELARALGLAVARTKGEDELVKLLLEKAEIEETRLKDPRAARESLRLAAKHSNVLSEEQRRIVAERQVELLRAEGLDDELALVLARKASLVAAGPTRSRVLVELARLLGRLGRNEQAVEAWHRALDEDPSDRTALASLQELCARAKDRRGHARALEREMEFLAQETPVPPSDKQTSEARRGDRERLVACALEAAKIHQELENPDAAVRALERALDREPASKAVSEVLAKIHSTRGHDAALYDVLRRRAQVSTDRAEQARVRERMARIAERLGDDEGAITDYQEVLVRRPRDRAAMAALKRLHAAREAWPEAAEVSERELTVVSELTARRSVQEGNASPAPSEPAESPGDSSSAVATPLPGLADLHLALGELYEKRLKKKIEAKQHYQLAHARAASDPRPLRGLERLHQEDQEWENLSRVRGSLRDLEEDPQKRASLALGIASAAERLERRADAIAALKGALSDVPDNAVALALLRQHLLAASRFAEAAEVLEREAGVARERDTQLARRLERAKLLVARLDDPGGAIAELERARALEPSNAEVLELLEGLYAKTADRARLARVLDDQARIEKDADKAADLLAREGRVLAGKEKLGENAPPAAQNLAPSQDLALAAEAYERALLRIPGRVPVIDALVELYEKLGKSRELARALHQRADRTEDEVAHARFERRAAEVEERELEDPALAARTLERLTGSAGAKAAWDLDGALSELARLRGALGEHAAREQALARRTALATTPDGRRTLLLERARVLEAPLGRPGAAAECVAEVQKLFPDDAALADELARLREAAGDSAGVVRAIDHALSLEKPTGRRERLVQLHRRRGELAAGLAYDPEKALESYRFLLEIDADDDAAREALEAILSREARAQELVQHYEKEVERRRKKGEGPPLLAGLERRRAELLRGPLADPAGAEKAYRAALALDQDDARAREGLEAVLRTEGKQEALAALLAENASRATSPMVAAEALREEAQVHEQRDDRKTAIDRLERALKATPEDRRTLRALVRLYRLEKRSEDLARILDLLVRALGSASPAERSHVLFERGLVLTELERPKEAEAALEEALDLDSKNVPAARAIAPLLIARDAWREVVRVYELEAQAKVDRARRVWLRCEIGRLKSSVLTDPEGAGRAFQDALALDAGSVTALRGLASVLRERGRARELATPLERLAEVAPSPEDRTAARRELAHLLEEKLEDPGGAAERYRQVLADHELDPDAVRGLARSLRALVAKGDARSRPALADAFSRELEVEEELARRFRLLLEAAALQEALAEEVTGAGRTKRLEDAFLAAEEACELEPANADALAAFARVAEKLGRWKELAEATEALAGLVDDKQRAAWMLRRAGKLRAHRLGDAAGAASAFEAAANVDPKDREALEALEPIARELRDKERWLASLRGQLALAPDDPRRAAVALRLGELHETAGDYSRAIEAYVLAREKGKSPQKKDAHQALDRCYRKTERWNDLARVLEARVEAEPESAVQLLLERARVLDERLSRYDKAADALRRALELAPDDPKPARWLERVLGQMARWDELAEFYEQEANLRGARGYEALVKLGRLLRDQLDDQEKAAAALQKAVTLQPTGIEAIEALRDLYAQVERWPELFEVLRLEIALLKEPRGREARLVRAARVAEEKLGDLAQAARCYAEASQLAPSDRSHLASLARVQEARGDEEGLVRTLEQDLALTRDPVEIVAIRKRLGSVYAERLYRRTDAIQRFREALTLAPDDEEALTALAGLYRSGESWAELAPVLERRAARARGKDGLTIRLELARVLASKLGRAEDALRMAAAARSIDPRSPDAIEIEVEVLRGLAGQSQAPQKVREDLAEALARLAAAKEDPKERATVLVDLARHLEESLERPDRALKALDEALARDPVHEKALARATRLQEALERWDELFATYERAIAATTDAAKRAPLLAKAAEVLERRKRDLGRADRLYREALLAVPDHLPATLGLARVLTALGAASEGADKARAAELARLEERTAELERSPEERARALARAGTVYRNAADDLATARARYEAALALAPDLFAALAPLAEILFGQDELDRALTLLERCAVAPELGQDPEHAAEILHALALARENKGDREGAASALRTALEHKAGHAQALEDLGRLLCEDGAFTAAVPVLSDLVARTRVPNVRAVHELSLAKALAKTREEERALDLFRKGLERLPDEQDAREAYATLLKARGDNDLAAREWKRLENTKDLARRARVFLALADLYEGPLRDSDAAAGYLRGAVDLEGAHRATTARRLAELHGRFERWNEAVTFLSKSIELEKDPKEKSQSYAKLGRLFRDRLRNIEMSRRCFEKSFELDPLDRHTLDSFARVLEAAGDFDTLEKAYAHAAEASRAAKQGDEASLRMRRADVLWRRLRKIKHATKEFEAVIALEPRHMGARAALAQVYLEAGDLAGVERIHREFLKEDPLVVDHYRTLERAWAKAGREDARAQAVQALAVLAAASESERENVATATAREPKARRGLSPEDWPRIVGDARGPIHEIVSALSETFDRSVPDDLKSYGVGLLKRSLPLEGDAFPEHRLVKRILDMFGVGEGELDLYWMSDWKRPEAILAHSKRPSLILCPAVFSGLEGAEKAFVIARAVALVPARLEAANVLATQKLERLVLAAAKAIAPEQGLEFSGDDEKEIRTFHSRVGKALTPELVAELKPAAQEIWKTQDKLNVEGFRRAVALTASRAGVLAAGGAFRAAHAVLKTNVALHGLVPKTTAEAVQAFREFAELRGILEFSVSQEYLEVRRELGLARGGNE